MPQEFNVLRCYSCETFQVHIVKKANKWCCKMCGEKQSVKKVYFQGTGKDCRLHVQSLNEKRILNDMNESIDNDISNSKEQETKIPGTNLSKLTSNQSKWNEYLNEVVNELSENEDEDMLTFERPNKRKLTKKLERHIGANEKKVRREGHDETDFVSTHHFDINVRGSENLNKLQINETVNFNENQEITSKMNENSNSKRKLKEDPRLEDFDEECTNIDNTENKFSLDISKEKHCEEENRKLLKLNTSIRENENNSTDKTNIYTCMTFSDNIFSSTDLNSLDDILEL